MGRSNDRQYSDIVRQELQSVLPAMRAEAARACGELELVDATPDIARLIDDPDPEVTMVAIEALGQVGGDEARHILERVATSDDEEIAEAAEVALAEYEFLHGDLKFESLWIDDLHRNGTEPEDEE